MKKRNTIVRFNPETDPHRSQTDWEWLDKAVDADIDFSDIPPLDEDFFRNAVVRMPRMKKMVSIRLDEELIEWYKRQGPGYQTRINAVLKAYMTASQSMSALRGDTDAVRKRARPARKALKASKTLQAPKGRDVPKIAPSRKSTKARTATR